MEGLLDIVNLGKLQWTLERPDLLNFFVVVQMRPLPWSILAHRSI